MSNGRGWGNEGEWEEPAAKTKPSVKQSKIVNSRPGAGKESGDGWGDSWDWDTSEFRTD